MHAGHAKNREKGIDIFNKKVGVFEVKKKTQVNGNRECQHQPSVQGSLCCCHPLYEVEIKKGGSQDYKDEPGCSPGIEKNTGDQGEIILEFSGQDIIDQQESREEIKNENAAAENHAWI